MRKFLIVAFDDGVAISLGAGCVPTTGGVLTCSGNSVDFSSVIISANGVPTLASPDLSAVTITAVRSATAGNHTLDVDMLVIGAFVAVGLIIVYFLFPPRTR
jgi:hypothetical protein